MMLEEQAPAKLISAPTSWDKGNKRLGEVWDAPKTPVWNNPQGQ